MNRYVVIGNPVSHSKSPRIHSLFAKQTGERVDYSTLLAERGEFVETISSFFSTGGKGANVTVPFKEEAFQFADALSPQAEKAEAVNTLSVDPSEKILGHNTDGIGLVADITRNHGGILAGKRVLILGAGGASRGIIGPIVEENPEALCIANRTPARAETLAEIFSDIAVIKACGFDDLAGSEFDWVINATAASLEGSVPDIPTTLVTPGTWCYDLMYANEPTAFCQWSEEAGAGKVMDGLGMLVEQAAESFLTWRGVRPQTAAVIEKLSES